MLAYVARKVIHLIPMLFVISFLIFLGMDLMPGDAVDYMISPDELAGVSPEALAAIRAKLGLDKPFVIRYFLWLGNLLRGDFGYSIQSGVPVSTLFLDTLPATLQLSLAALLLSTVLGSILGVVSAIYRNSIADHILSVAGMVGVAIPQFLFGLICIIVFVFKLDWLPVGGRMPPGQGSFFQGLRYLILPASVLGLSLTAGVMRYALEEAALPGRHEPSNRKPIELEHEHDDADQAEQELRNGHADHAGHRKDVVGDRVAVDGADHAQDASEHRGEQERGQRELQGRWQRVQEQGADRHPALDAVPEVAPEEVAQPQEIADHEGLVQPEFRADRGQGFGRDARQLVGAYHVIDRVARHQVHPQEYEEADDEQHRNQVDHFPGNVSKHSGSSARSGSGRPAAA
jgi:hypothetical protein